MADTDSEVMESAPSDDSPVGSQMGDGLFEDTGQSSAADDSVDTQPDAREDDGGHSEEAPQSTDNFDTSKLDFQRVNLEEVPEAYRDVVGSAQRAIREAQGGFTREQQALRDELNALREQMTQSTVKDTVAETLQNFTQQDEFTNLSPEQREAIDTVKNLIGAETKDLREQVTTFQELQQTVQQLQQTIQTQQQAQLQAEVNEARQLYGTDVDNYGQQIYALMQTTNPQTGQRYSIRGAYELLSGKALQQSQDMRNNNVQVRNGAKQSAGRPTTSVQAPDGGTLSEQDALQELARLGFE